MVNHRLHKNLNGINNFAWCKAQTKIRGVIWIKIQGDLPKEGIKDFQKFGEVI